jgi:hypothetical protein
LSGKGSYLDEHQHDQANCQADEDAGPDDQQSFQHSTLALWHEHRLHERQRRPSPVAV